MRLQRFLLSVATAFAATHMAAAIADTVEIHGSTTVHSVLVTPYKTEIERLSGHALKIVPSSSGAGLTDLVGMTTDIAMTSAPFKDLVQQVGKSSTFRGLTLEESDFNVVNLGRAEVLFIVHPDNKIRQLSRAQLQGLLSGSITNWRDVGGADMPVTVVSEEVMGAMRTEISRKLLNGKDLTPTILTVVQLATNTPQVVAKNRGALGYVSSAMPANQRPGVTVVPHEGKIEQVLFIITRPGASEAVEKMVGAIKTVGAKALSQ